MRFYIAMRSVIYQPIQIVNSETYGWPPVPVYGSCEAQKIFDRSQ